MVELITRRVTIPTKSSQSGDFPCNYSKEKEWQQNVDKKKRKENLKLDKLQICLVMGKKASGKTKEKNNLNRVLSTYSSISQSNGHDSCSFHNPWKRVPHKPQELQNLILLQFPIIFQKKKKKHLNHTRKRITRKIKKTWIT